MKIVIAPDKFKGSLSGLEFCDAVASGIKQASDSIEILKCPLADGGDGTIEVIEYHLKGKTISLQVNDPLFRPVEASYLYNATKSIAYIEMAEASGLKLLKEEDRNCMFTSSFGTGEMILDAINKGAKEIILGVGGSATNDCGIGMATALGYTFLDKNNQEITPIGQNLSMIHKIKDSAASKKLNGIKFKIACDVTNPLYGKNGAAYIYGPQKGANLEEVAILDKGLRDFSVLLNNFFNVEIQNVKGSGAAGGMGGGAMLFLNGILVSGIGLIMELANFSTIIENADCIITGEGQLDTQTISGKTISGILKEAKAKNIPVAAFCGSVTASIKEQESLGLSYVSSIIKSPGALATQLPLSYDNLIFTTYNFIKSFYYKK